MYDRILVPVAGDEADTAVRTVRRHVESLAATYDAELIVLTVVDTVALDPLGLRGAALGAERERQEQAAEETAESVVESVQSDIDARPMIGHGSPHRAIGEAADKHGCDLIVMATHGRTGLAHGVLGSVTERVLRTAETPVLAVPWK